MTQDPKSKATIVLKLLEEGDAMLCLDARHEGVAVPREHAQNPSLRLVLNLNFPNPIEVTDEGVSVNLAFGGRRFACYIPMQALWAAFNPETMQGMMWPDSMPPEVHDELADQRGSAKRPASVRSSAPAAPPQEDAPATAQTKGETTQTPSTPRQRGHLRVVK